MPTLLSIYAALTCKEAQVLMVHMNLGQDRVGSGSVSRKAVTLREIKTEKERHKLAVSGGGI